MTRLDRIGRWLLATLGAGVTVAVLALASKSGLSPSAPETAEAPGATETTGTQTRVRANRPPWAPDYPDPIFTSSEALARSAELWPPDVPITAEAAHLVSMGTAETWLDSNLVFDDHVPAWITGFLGDSLTVQDVLHVPGNEITDTTPVVGAFVIWDANSGAIAAEGVLVTAAEFEALAALADERVTIQPATDEPAIPTIVPEGIPPTATLYPYSPP